MRKFYLVNEHGQEFPLNDVRTGFLDSPDGLGWEGEYSYTRFGTAYISGAIESKQATISGSLVFGTAAPYTAKQAFLRYVRGAKKLALKWVTTAGTYLKDVDLVSIKVSEIKDGDLLECPVTLMARSLWYSPAVLTLVVGEDTAGLSEVIWDIEFTSVFRALSAGAVEVTNDGSNPAGMTIVFNGAIANPVVVLTQDDEELARVEIPYTIEEGEQILYSSRDTDLYCVAVDGQGEETNLVPLLSIENENFFKLPVGQSTLTFSADSAITSTIQAKVYREYKAV